MGTLYYGLGITNKFMKTLLIIVAAALLSGCVVVSTSPQAAVARKVIGGPDDYGQYPTNYEYLVNTWIKVYLKDPDSVKDLKVFQPQKFFLNICSDNALGYLTVHSLPQNTQFYGYAVNFFCNGKNSFGAYEGVTGYWIFIRDGEIIDCH